MFSIQLRKTRHDSLCKTSQFFCSAGFVFAIVLFAYTAFSAHLRATSILSDHLAVDAALKFDRISQVTGIRGSNTTAYHFNYQFTIDDRPYEGSFTTNAANAVQFLDADSVTIAFSNSGHEFDRLALLQRNESLLVILGRLLIVSLVTAIVFAILHGIVTARLFVARKDNREPDEEDDYRMPIGAR